MPHRVGTKALPTDLVGEVLGTAVGLHNAATIVLSIALAFLFGYGLTMRGVLRAGVGFR